MDNTRKIMDVLNTDEPWTLDHEEVVQDSDTIHLPGYEGVMGSGLAVPFPNGAPQCPNSKRVEVVDSLPDPPGGRSSGIHTGSLPAGNVQNHFHGGPLAPPQSSSVCQGDVTRVEVTTGRGSRGGLQPFEHDNARRGPTLQNASGSIIRGDSITIEENTSRDRNYVSHTTQPNLKYSVHNNVQNVEDRAKIDAFLTQVGFLTEQVSNLQKDNAAFRIALQHSTMDSAASSGRGVNSVTCHQSDPTSLPMGSIVGQNKAPMNLVLPSHAANKPMHSGADVDFQSCNYRVARNYGEDASIQSEEGNTSRYDLWTVLSLQNYKYFHSQNFIY